MGGVAAVFIDEVDVTDFALEGSATRALNRPATAQVRLPMSQAIGGVGSLLKVYFETDLDTTPQLFHHGRVLVCETDASEDTGYTVYNSTDGFELWSKRPVRDPGTGFTSSCGTVAPIDDPGDFSKPSIIEDFVTGPEIVEAMMYASQNIALGADDAEGPLFLTNGTFACGGIDLTGAPVDWPMTMAQLATLLVGTGELDLVITPIELDINGNYGQLDAYNGDYGTDLSSFVAFQYGMGVHNVRALRWNENMTNECNKLWYYLGPRIDDQHWRANITGSDHGVLSPPGLAYPPGGDLSPPYSATNNQIGVLRYQSQQAVGVRMEVRIYDASGDEETLPRELYRRLWQVESWLRAQPQTLIHITPTRDTEIGSFDIGDLVLVEAVADVRGGFSGAQRVYEYTIGWDSDSVLALSELQTSADNAGFEA